MTTGNEGLDHVGFGVSDQAASIAWYGELLGLEQVHEADWGSTPAMLLGPDTGSGVALFQATERFPIGFHHVAFRVTGEAFAAARARFDAEGRAYDFHDHVAALSLYVKDPDGITVELTTYEVEPAKNIGV
jgi:catechol 2,3-dioxygenase-like lactoylglutathione lyase family enzyme